MRQRNWRIGAALTIASTLALTAGVLSMTGLASKANGGAGVLVANGYRVEFRESAASRVMKPAEFIFSVQDEEGRPVAGAIPRVVLSMPNMFCGRFEADVAEVEPGVYRASAIPVMKGKWQAKLTLDAGEGESVFVHPFRVV